MKSKFILIAGPSGTGKSRLIKNLQDLDSRFVYVSPYVTRPLREGETNKVSVTKEEILSLRDKGELVVSNDIYGMYTATPKAPINKAFLEDKLPILDVPLMNIPILTKYVNGEVFIVYVYPPELPEWKRRLEEDGRDPQGLRLQHGLTELADMKLGRYDNISFNLEVVSHTGQDKEMAQYVGIEIYKNLQDAEDKEGKQFGVSIREMYEWLG